MSELLKKRKKKEKEFRSSRNIWKLLDGFSMIIDIDDGVIPKGRRRRAGLEGYTSTNYSFAVDICEDDSLELTPSFSLNI